MIKKCFCVKVTTSDVEVQYELIVGDLIEVAGVGLVDVSDVGLADVGIAYVVDVTLAGVAIAVAAPCLLFCGEARTTYKCQFFTHLLSLPIGYREIPETKITYTVYASIIIINRSKMMLVVQMRRSCCGNCMPKK